MAVNNILSIKARTANVKSTLKFYGDWSLGTARGRAALCWGGSQLQDGVLSGGGLSASPMVRTQTVRGSVAGLPRDRGGTCHELGEGGGGGRRSLLA